MAEIINLRQARKRKQRGDRERLAEQNRLLHGRTKTEKVRTTSEKTASARRLDGHRRETPDDGRGQAVTLVAKHSVTIRGHRTSFSLEQPFFDDLLAIAAERALPLAALVAEIDAARPRQANLSSAIRVHVLAWAKAGTVA